MTDRPETASWAPPATAAENWCWWRCSHCREWSPDALADPGQPFEHAQQTGHQVQTIVMTVRTYGGLTTPCTLNPSPPTSVTGLGESPAYLP